MCKFCITFALSIVAIFSASRSLAMESSRYAPLVEEPLQHAASTVKEMPTMSELAKDPSALVRAIEQEFEAGSKSLGNIDITQRDVTILLGSTGVGKTTIANLLLSAETLMKQGTELVLAAGHERRALPIGIGSDSETRYPQAVELDDGTVVIDLPGFNDTAGTVRNFINAALIQKIILGAKTIKLILAIDQNNITSNRGAEAKKLFAAVKDFFGPRYQHLITSGACVITKALLEHDESVVNLSQKLTGVATVELKEQICEWYRVKRLCHVSSPLYRSEAEVKQGLKEERQAILSAIRDIKPQHIEGPINISTIYPHETHSELVGVFLSIMRAQLECYMPKPQPGEVLTHHKIEEVRDLIAGQGFIDVISLHLLSNDLMASLLREFADTAYQEALKKLAETDIPNCVAELQKKMEQRKFYFDEQIVSKIKAANPSMANPQFVMLNSEATADLYAKVCEAGMAEITTDPKEQIEVRKRYIKNMVDTIGVPNIKIVRVGFFKTCCEALAKCCGCWRCGCWSIEEVQALSGEEIHELSRQQIYHLGELVQYLKAEQIRTFTPEQIEWFTREQRQAFTPAQIRAFTPEQIRTFTPEQIGAFTSEQIGAFTQEQIGAFTSEQIGAFTREQIKALTPAQIRTFTPEQIGALTPAQIRAFTLEQIRTFTPEQIGAFTSEQIGAFTQEQIWALTREQIKSLTPAQIRTFTPEQVWSFTTEQIRTFTPEQMGAFTKEQIQVFNLRQNPHQRNY